MQKVNEAGASVIFDVGSNHGHWSIDAAQVCPQASIYAFEPVRVTYESLKENTRNLPMILPTHAGLSKQEGEVEFRFSKEHDTLSSAHVDSVHTLEYELVKCPMTTGDGFMREHNIDGIDFLKLDVEGAEMEALIGFSNALKSGEIRAIQFEYGMASILSKVLLYDYYQFFTEHKYKVGAIYPTYVDFREYKFSDENFLTPNFLAVLETEKSLIDSLSC
jgi:FkbM family methyltransferase